MLETILLVFAILNLVVVLLMLQKMGHVDNRELKQMMREEIAALRNEITLSARQNREELNASVRAFGDSLSKQSMEMAMLQKVQLDTLTASNEQRLDALRKSMEAKLTHLQGQQNTDALQNRTELAKSLHSFEEKFHTSVNELNATQRQKFSDLAEQLEKLVQTSADKLERMRGTLEAKLQELRTDNTEKLEMIRATVEEKLQATLEKRLGESFKQVSERLEQVHQGLGEMQNLATGVGDLKKALVNVKVRGTLGEIQLASILEEILTPEQYAVNVAVRPGRNERVEFALKMPGKDEHPVWLPIDAKFPMEDYQRLLDAYESADLAQAEACAKQLEASIKKCAKDIRDKYLDPPATTDFGIMFLPFEGLYAEVLRRNGLFETLMRDYKVAITGPTTLAAFLNSLQMGFRTLTIEKRTSEVWSLLGAVKTEFGRFGALLDKTRKKLQEASNTIDVASRKSRTIERKLKDVQELPDLESEQVLLPVEENS
ncbi:MAG TPA: DNA recombination protein RmuC [Oscillospiraceae bacterium]|nr:DNA recombination protein RmuC [Oscillospiraceae bacterium]